MGISIGLLLHHKRIFLAGVQNYTDNVLAAVEEQLSTAVLFKSLIITVATTLNVAPVVAAAGKNFLNSGPDTHHSLLFWNLTCGP